MNWLKRFAGSFESSEEEPGLNAAAGGHVKGLSRMHMRVALAVFLLLLVAPPLVVFVNRWLALAVVGVSVALLVSVVTSPLLKRIHSEVRRRRREDDRR